LPDESAGGGVHAYKDDSRSLRALAWRVAMKLFA
jgi:hypothetical protein